MIKTLEQAVEKVKRLSEERQQYAADLLEQIADAGDGIYALSEQERRLVREGLDEIERGEIASQEEARAIFDKYRASRSSMRGGHCAISTRS